MPLAKERRVEKQRMGDYENAVDHDIASSPPAANNCSNSSHRSAYMGSPSRTDRRKTSTGSPAMPLNTSKVETLLTGSPVRRPECPATPTRRSSTRNHSHSLSTPRRVRASANRSQSPCLGGLHPPAPGPGPDLSRKCEGEEKGALSRGHGSVEKKPSKAETPEKKMTKSTSRDLAADRSAEPSPVTPTGKPVAGTTDAEEASRLLAERRRKARLQKEQEERERREQEEEERLREEQQRRRQEEQQARQEEEARQAKEAWQREELERRRREEEERQQREIRWKELQAHLQREKEEVDLQAQKKAEQQRQERELMKQQEEQERLQRKKRIEEIMKRTRKSDSEVKKESIWAEPSSPGFTPQPLSAALLGLTERSGEGHRPQVDGHLSERCQRELCVLGSPTLRPEPSPINLELLGVNELADEVQSMDVSPVSKEDVTSVTEFSPMGEVHHNGMRNSQTLEDLLELTDREGTPGISPSGSLGDCNKNLIAALCSPGADSQAIRSSARSADKLNIQ